MKEVLSKITAAGIDIGSNSVLLAVVSFDRKGSFKILSEKIETPRIGKQVLQSGIIQEEGLRKLINVLNKFKLVCRRYSVSVIICAATEAFRRAKNKNYVLRRIYKKTGLRIKILTPAEEAYASFLSATHELPRQMTKKSLVIDIGAASTEQVGLMKDGKLTVKSLPIGSLVLKERLNIEYPLSKMDIANIRKFLAKELKRNRLRGNWKNLIAVGGTATTIPSLIKKMSLYENRELDFYRVSLSKIEKIIKWLSTKTRHELSKIKGIPHGRSDIFLPGLLILDEIMKAHKSSSLLIRNRGVRFGILFDYFKKNFPGAQIRATP